MDFYVNFSQITTLPVPAHTPRALHLLRRDDNDDDDDAPLEMGSKAIEFCILTQRKHCASCEG